MGKMSACGSAAIDAQFDPVALRLIALLRAALPDCSSEDIIWGYQFFAGALIYLDWSLATVALVMAPLFWLTARRFSR